MGCNSSHPPVVQSFFSSASPKRPSASSSAPTTLASVTAASKPTRDGDHGAELLTHIERDYVLQDVLGRGHYATVYRARRNADDKLFAVKLISSKTSSLKRRQREISILLKASGHPNVVSLIDYSESAKGSALVLELVTGGELFDKIVQGGAYSEAEACEHVRQVASALQYLHKLGIVHRDLKPENLLLSDSSPSASLKIADFGLSSARTPTTVCGTWAYCAPEVKDPTRQRDMGYTSKVDVWSLGVIAFVILSGYHPFDPTGDAPSKRIQRNVMEANFDFLDPCWDTISTDARDFISKCLVVDASKRMSSEVLLEHPWLSAGQAGRLPSTPLSPDHGRNVKQLRQRMAWLTPPVHGESALDDALEGENAACAPAEP